MSSPAVAPLDGESGYLRWKESVLLRLHTLGLAHVLSEEEEEEEDRPTAGDEHRARDDALCRGHILATLSDRILPAYAPHATAGAVWRAVARTYDLDSGKTMACRNKASNFRYDEGQPLLGQLALLQALVSVGWPGRLDETGLMPTFVRFNGFPPELGRKVAMHNNPHPCIEEIWEIARDQVVSDRLREIYRAQPTTDGQRSSSLDGFRPRKRGRRHRYAGNNP